MGRNAKGGLRESKLPGPALTIFRPSAFCLYPYRKVSSLPASEYGRVMLPKGVFIVNAPVTR